LSKGGKEMSVEDCIKVLENIKERGKSYPETYSHFSKEYCEKLAEVEALAIDTVISILRKRKENE
jgi:hypothetical protein